MSLTETQISEIKNLINDQLYFNADNGSATNFTLQEKVSYALKLSLQRVTTDAFATGKEWFNEPSVFNPIFKNQIYSKSIPSYGDIKSFYCVVKFKGKKYITNIKASTIFTNLANNNLVDILDNTTQVLPPSTPDTTTSYEDSRTPISEDFDASGRLMKLPRSSWAFFNYWKKYLTGSKAKNNLDDANPTKTLNTGTYPDVNEKSTILTIISSTVNANKNYSNLENNPELINEFLNYNPLEIIPNDVVDSYITSNGGQLDQIDKEYTDLLKNTNNSLNINLGVSTYSTWSGVPVSNITDVNNSQYSDNMAFYNPLLPFSLGERYGYFSRDAGDGYYMISSNSSKKNITASFGQGGSVKEGTMIFSADTGFILFFGIGNVITGEFNGVKSPISVSQPPIISCFKYVGGTFDDGIINSGTENPLPINSSLGDIFINTTENIIYLLKNNDAEEKEWVSLGGSTSIDQGEILPSTDGLEGGELFITTGDNKLYRFDGTEWVALSGEGGGGGGLFKSESDASASELIVSQTEKQPASGDLYFNTKESIFNYYADETSAADKWVPIALSRLSGQPPPLMDISVNATTAFIEVRWRKPKQIATSMTSDILYTDTNSPASYNNWLSQNIIYFPIVNRFIIKLTKVDADNNPIDGDAIEPYPLYLKSNGDAFKSTIEPDSGYVIFRKGDIISTKDTDENTYVKGSIKETPDNNLLENMPTGIRIYKSVPVQADRNSIDVSDGVILPFSSTVAGKSLNANFDRYRIDIWMENNSPDTQILPVTVFSEYFIAGVPETPREVTLKLGQNSGGIVDNAVTQSVIETIDPSFVAGTDNSQDGIVNFSEIHFEWSIDNFADTCFNFVKIRAKDSVNDAKSADYTSSSERALANGIMSLNRPVDNTKRFYTFDITSDFLGSTGYDQIDFDNPVEISVRISYKNSSNPDFGNTLASSIFFGIPSKHSISNVKAGIFNSKNQFQIQLSSFSNSQTIINNIGESTKTLSTNTKYALFIKDVQVRAEYQIDNGDIVLLEDYSFSYSKSSSTVDQNSTSLYYIDIPVGLPSGTFSNSNIKWRFQTRVRNNLLNGYSDWSDIAGDGTSITDTDVNAIKIEAINTNDTVNDNTITNISYQSDNDLAITWNHPASYDRGIHTTTKTVASYPKVYNYDVSFAREDVTANRIEVGTNLSSTRTSDPTNSTELSVFNLIDKNGVSSNDEGSGRTDAVKTINVEVLQRNEFVSTYSRISRDFFYLLEDPNNPTQETANHSISSNSALNKLDVQWTKPAYQGFKTGLTNTPSNTTVEINQYRVSILADRANSDSTFYRDQHTTSQSLNDIIVAAGNRASEARTTIVSGTDDVKRTSTIPIGYTGTLSNVLVYPETQYKVTVKSRNIFNIEGDSSLNMTITTGIPDKVRSIMTSSTIPFNSTIDNFNGVNQYANNGFILANTPDNTTPSTGNQITNVNDLGSYSANHTHLMNGVKFNTFLGRDNYVTNVSAIKLRRFVIKNMADGTGGTQVYAYGNNTNQFAEDGASLPPIVNMFSIETVNNEDVYDPANKRDGHNRGYWWEESFKWTLDFENNPTFGVPILLQFQVRYNNKLTSSTDYAGSSIEDDGTYDEITLNILINNKNSNNYAYFDDLNADPGIQKRGTTETTDYITEVTNNNKINGIPNLYPMGTVDDVLMGYQYKLNYELTNYSEYYGLNFLTNFTSHRLKSGSTVVKDNIENRSWSTKSNCERSSNRWTITDLMITQDDIGTTNTGEYSDARIHTLATNTRGSTNVQLQDSGNLYRFIYDEATVTTFKNVFSSLRNVPTNYNPFYAGINETDTTGDNIKQPSAFTAYADTNNDLQMSMWNGRFYSNKGWQTATGITTTNCAEYGIPNTLPVFTTDTNYSWTIFEYEFTNDKAESSDQTIYKGVISLGDDTKTNVTLSDLQNDDVVVFIFNVNYNTAVSMESNAILKTGFRLPYYWLKACNGKDKDGNSNNLDDQQAGDGKAFYVDDVADSNLINASEVQFKDGDTIGGFTGNELSSDSDFDNNKRIYGFRFNKFTVGISENAVSYIAIGTKNNIDKYVSKPKLWLMTANSKGGIIQFT